MPIPRSVRLAALPAVLLLIGLAIFHDGDGPRLPIAAAPLPAGPPAPSGASGVERRSFPMVATTPAELRRVVHFCRSTGPQDLDELRQAALHSPDALVAGNALRALGRLGAVAGDQQILALLDDSRLRVRQELVLALGSSGAASAVSVLTPLLQGSDLEVRPLVVRSLARIGGPEARRALEALDDDPTCTEVERLLVREASRDQPVPGPAADSR